MPAKKSQQANGCRHRFPEKYYEALFAIQKSACALCGKRVTKNTRSIDHKIPCSKGGSDRLTNLQLVHRGCNSSKGTSSQAAAKKRLQPKRKTPKRQAGTYIGNIRLT